MLNHGTLIFVTCISIGSWVAIGGWGGVIPLQQISNGVNWREAYLSIQDAACLSKYFFMRNKYIDYAVIQHPIFSHITISAMPILTCIKIKNIFYCYLTYQSHCNYITSISTYTIIKLILNKMYWKWNIETAKTMITVSLLIRYGTEYPNIFTC